MINTTGIAKSGNNAKYGCETLKYKYTPQITDNINVMM